VLTPRTGPLSDFVAAPEYPGAKTEVSPPPPELENGSLPWFVCIAVAIDVVFPNVLSDADEGIFDHGGADILPAPPVGAEFGNAPFDADEDIFDHDCADILPPNTPPELLFTGAKVFVLPNTDVLGAALEVWDPPKIPPVPLPPLNAEKFPPFIPPAPAKGDEALLMLPPFIPPLPNTPPVIPPAVGNVFRFMPAPFIPPPNTEPAVEGGNVAVGPANPFP